nr:hypothetical protein [uncultured Halomonas sp.]
MMTRSLKSFTRQLSAWLLAGAGLFSLGGCTTLVDNALTNAVITPDTQIRARSGTEVMGPHMIMTRQQPLQPGDREYARALADQLTVATARYRDVEVAKADGYESFPPDPPPGLGEIHYINRKRSAEEADEIDPARPGAPARRSTDASRPAFSAGWPTLTSSMRMPRTPGRRR